MHVTKALYTFSYMCVTAGSAGLLFAGIYLMVGSLTRLVPQKPFCLRASISKNVHMFGLVYTGGCVWIQTPSFCHGVDGETCLDDLYSRSLQHFACFFTGILLAESSK